MRELFPVLEKSWNLNSLTFVFNKISFIIGFLTAMRQEVTRAHKGWSLDSVILYNDVTKSFKEDINSPPAVSISKRYIYH